VKLTPWPNLVKPERGTLAPLAATSLIVALGLTLVWQLTDQRDARVDRFGASMAGSVAELCVEPLLKQDRMHLGVLSNRIAAVAEVSGVGIFTLDDQVLALSGKLGAPRYAHPISFDDGVVGYVRISVDANAFADGLGHTGRALGILLVMVISPLLVAGGTTLRRRLREEASANRETQRRQQQDEARRSELEADMVDESAIDIHHYLLAINLHNQLQLSSAEREFELSLCLESAEDMAALYQGQVALLPGVGVLIDFDHTDDPDRAFQIVCAAMVLARVLREETSRGGYRLGLHLITRPGDESLSLDDPAVADAALLSALAREMTLAVSGSCYSALTRLERLEITTSAHPLLDQLTTCSPDCHLITDLAPGYQALVLQQTEKLTGQRRSTARESTF
jgi:uncharacterized membrane protein affecting hemolysin expression